jgi:hypothetical protein
MIAIEAHDAKVRDHHFSVVKGYARDETYARFYGHER